MSCISRRQGGVEHAFHSKYGYLPFLNCILGAMAIAISSWNRSLHAYGMNTCTMLVFCLQAVQWNWFFLRLATAIMPHSSQTWTR